MTDLRAGEDLSLEEMTLQATGAGTGRESLDIMAKMVYQCAEKGKTIRKVMDTLGLEQQMTHRIIQQLVGQGLVDVLPPKNKKKAAVSNPHETSKVKPETSSEPHLTEAYLEALDKQHERCANANYYDMLEIDPDAPRNELRARYFELSKRYHPDKVFGEIPDDVRRKISYVFQQLTTAYDTLSNPRRRAEYNRSIAEELELRSLEKKLKQAVRESVPSTPTENTAPASLAPEDGERISVSPRPVNESVVKPRTKSTEPEKGKEFVPSKPPRKTYSVRRNQIRRNIANRALQNLLSRRPSSPLPKENLEQMLDRASSALDQSQYPAAIKILVDILQMNPGNQRALEMLASANAAKERVQVQQHIRRGRFAKNQGRFDEARWHYEQALSMEKDNVDARHLLAEVLLETKRNLSKALELMKEVIVLGGQRARYYVTLGDIFLSLKEVVRAQEAYKKALRLEPDNRDIQKRIK